jgi:signal transduction histidine kinase
VLLASLTNRIFLAAALLVVLAIGFTAAFVSARVTSQAEAELHRGLVESGAVVGRQSEALVETFTLLTRLIADLPKLKAAVATDDPPTVQPLAAEYQQMLARSSLVVVTDHAGVVLASAGPGLILPASPGTMPMAGAAVIGGPASVFRVHPGGILQVLSVPITVGAEPARLAGTLSVGFLLDRALASDFKQLTGSDIAFGLDGRIRAATLPEAVWPALEQARQTDRVSTLATQRDEYVLLSTPLALGPAGLRPSQAIAPVAGAPFVLVVRSRTEQLRFLGPIQTVIGVTVLVTMLLATVLSYAVARTVTRPLAAITGVMREVAATGDLTRKIPPRSGRWEDEDARLLASTFNTLTDSIARFEKEASQRERLSSLGRLSSVVAHEIRNPLMIIKAAVRTLRRPETRPAVVQEALQDIDVEVVRLNRIVSEVLDYAKPITFTWQSADINAICREAAQAVQVAEPGVGIEVTLDADVLLILTDADRLRAVLVNVLTNACQAVRAARDAAAVADVDPQPGVDLRTAVLGDGGTMVVVRDNGCGIDAAVVARVFEPYFTTRRAGTGLGLAIARNIVEGLGGTIAIRSDGHSGTDVSITLPGQPPAASGSGGVSTQT